MGFSDTESAPTISLSRRYRLQGIQDALGALARLCHRNSESRTPVAKRIFGGGELHPERSDQGSAAAFERRKGDTGRDRTPPRPKGTGGRGSIGQARYSSGLVSKGHHIPRC